MDKKDLKNNLQKIIQDFKNGNGYERKEDWIQSQFTIPVFHLLGWEKKNIIINESRDSQKKKRPDILLKYENTGTELLIIESKDANNKDVLDGQYPGLKFTEQLFKYLEGAGLFWGILTNFIEWRVYNSHQKTLYKNRKYAFYDLLWQDANKDNYIDLMSDEGLEFLIKLSFENLSKNSGKIDTDPIYYPIQKDLEEETIKEEFFIGIKKWRYTLIKYLTQTYNTDNVDIVAQQLLDRVIFIEICHDKNIIGQDILAEILQSEQNKYSILKDKFRTMDDLFNSELFVKSEVDGINITDDVLEKVLIEINKIDFKKLSVHIIGEIYERFLGEIKRGSTKEKEKKKKQEQGVYYTPTYITKYMIKNTVGKLLESINTEAEIKKIRILDPACGSGSFLISVFDEFFNAYKRICTKNKSGYSLFEFDLKKQILQNNIFGVDIDDKAVEITKLNLLIKALEGLKPQDLKDSKHLLPNLSLNIRCGNSIIGGDSTKIDDDCKIKIQDIIKLKNDLKSEQDYDKSKLIMKNILENEYFINNRLNQWIDEKTRQHKNPFNFEVAFCEVFKEGGFDCVLGNPPYLKEGRVNKSVFDGLHTSPYYQGKMDIWYIFASKSIDLLKNGGLHSFIATNNWITSSGALKFINKVLNETKIELFFDFRDFKVFKPKASIQTMIYTLAKEKALKPYKADYYKVEDSDIEEKEIIEYLQGQKGNIKISHFASKIDSKKMLNKNINFSNSTYSDLLSKIEDKSNYKINKNFVWQGIVSPQEDVIESHLEKLDDKRVKKGDGIFVLKKSEIKELDLNKSELELLKPYFTTDQISRYSAINKKERYIIYTDKKFKEPKNMSPYPNIKKHLDKFQRIITSDFKPYGLHRARKQILFEKPKILALRKSVIPTFSYVDFDCFVSQSFNIINPNDVDLLYLTGLLNSKLIIFWLKYRGKMQGDIYQIDTQPILNLPIYRPGKQEAEVQNKLIGFVNNIIKLKQDNNNIETNEIKNIEEEMDILVYKIYGIDIDEQKIIKDSIGYNFTV